MDCWPFSRDSDSDSGDLDEACEGCNSAIKQLGVSVRVPRAVTPQMPKVVACWVNARLRLMMHRTEAAACPPLICSALPGWQRWSCCRPEQGPLTLCAVGLAMPLDSGSSDVALFGRVANGPLQKCGLLDADLRVTLTVELQVTLGHAGQLKCTCSCLKGAARPRSPTLQLAQHGAQVHAPPLSLLGDVLLVSGGESGVKQAFHAHSQPLALASKVLRDLLTEYRRGVADAVEAGQPLELSMDKLQLTADQLHVLLQVREGASWQQPSLALQVRERRHLPGSCCLESCLCWVRARHGAQVVYIHDFAGLLAGWGLEALQGVAQLAHRLHFAPSLVELIQSALVAKAGGVRWDGLAAMHMWACNMHLQRFATALEKRMADSLEHVDMHPYRGNQLFGLLAALQHRLQGQSQSPGAKRQKPS